MVFVEAPIAEAGLWVWPDGNARKRQTMRLKQPPEDFCHDRTQES